MSESINKRTVDTWQEIMKEEIRVITRCNVHIETFPSTFTMCPESTRNHEDNYCHNKEYTRINARGSQNGKRK